VLTLAVLKDLNGVNVLSYDSLEKKWGLSWNVGPILRRQESAAVSHLNHEQCPVAWQSGLRRRLREAYTKVIKYKEHSVLFDGFTI